MTWTACECGCGQSGEDDVAQFCIEEAVLERLEWEDLRERRGQVDEGPELTPFQQARTEHEARMSQIRSAAS